MARLSPAERQMLVDCAAGREMVIPDQANWDGLIQAALYHWIGPLLYSGLEGKAPPEIIAPLAASYSESTRFNRLLRNTTEEVLAAFDRAGIPVIVFKGPLEAARIYHSSAHRRFHDVDLLVAPEYLERAESALTEIGYRLISLNPADLGWLGNQWYRRHGGPDLTEDEIRSLYRRYHCHLVLMPSEDHGLRIDLHWQFFPPGRLTFPVSDCWQRTEQVEMWGRPARALSPLDSLLHLLLHMLASDLDAVRLLALADVSRTIALITDREWELLVERAQQYRLAPAIRLSLEFASRITGAQAPAWALSRLPRPNLRSRIAFRALSPNRFIRHRGRLNYLLWDLIRLPRVGPIWSRSWWEVRTALANRLLRAAGREGQS